MDVPGRDELENKLARSLGRLLRAQMGRLMELMGDPPKIENVPSSFWDEQGVEFDKTLRPFLQKLFQDQAARMIADTPLGVDWALVNERAVRWARAYTYELVSGINATSRQVLQRAVGNYFTEQMTIGELEDMISGTFGPIRAEMISVTEITRASARGEDALWEELKEQGIEMVTTWNTNNDELVCEVCGPLHDQPAAGRENGEPYWNHPEGYKVTMPAHPRCVLPGNYVFAPGGISVAIKGFYNGGAVEIHTSGGRRLTVTENHPILTSGGWVPAKFLRQGDNVFVTTDIHRIAATINPDDDNGETLIEDIFSAFKETSGFLSATMPTTAENFHGDGTGFHNGNIDVVISNRLLLDNGKPSIPEILGHSALNDRGVRSPSLFSECLFDFEIIGKGPSSHGGMSATDLISSLGGGHSLPLDRFCFGLRPDFDAAFHQLLVESQPAKTHLVTDFIFRFAGQITVDKIAEIRYYQYMGHVFDLQNDLYELYTCNSIITHNCRCFEGNELPEVTGG